MIQWRRFGWEPGAPFSLILFLPTTDIIPVMPNDHHNAPTGHLSYYGLSLLEFLRDGHPELAADSTFIEARAAQAAGAYSDVIRSGGTHPEAEHRACEVLYRGLHFSLYNTLVNILWDEFPDQISEMEAREAARVMLSFMRGAAAQYDLTDDFASSPQYELLYTELTGNVQILLDHGLQ